MKELVIKYIDKVIEYYSSKGYNGDLLNDMRELESKLLEHILYEQIELIGSLAMNAHFCNKTYQHIYKAYQAFGYDDLNELIEVE